MQYTTCAHTGKAKYTCGLCGYSEERTEDIKGGSYHNLVDEKVEPTCTDYGYTIHRCTDCSYVKIDNDYAHKLSHSYEDKVISQATKDSVGVVQKICSGCGKSQKEFFSNYFTDITYSSRKNAEADLAAMKLVEQLGLNIGNKTDLEKLCILKQWYCDNTSYDATYSKYSAYDILVDHTSVCQGYAESLCLMLPKCGIETYICSSNKLNHAWNLAKIDGVWTYTDFVGGIGFNSENVILGSNAIGRTDDVIIRELDPSNGNNSGKTVNVSKSQIDQTLRLFMLDTTELDVIEGPGYYKYKIGNTTWTHTFKNN